MASIETATVSSKSVTPMALRANGSRVTSSSWKTRFTMTELDTMIVAATKSDCTLSKPKAPPKSRVPLKMNSAVKSVTRTGASPNACSRFRLSSSPMKNMTNTRPRLASVWMFSMSLTSVGWVNGPTMMPVVR